MHPRSPIDRAQALFSERPAGLPALDLSQGMPSDPLPPELAEAAAEAARLADIGLYPPRPGLPALREALAADLSRTYDAWVAPEEVLVTAGCNQAFCLTISALAGPGDEVVLPCPFYFNHDMWLRLDGITPVHLPVEPGAVPRPEAARELITDRTRAIVLVSPGNPTGTVIPGPVLEAFADLAVERDLVLVLDETYRAFRDDPAPAHRLFSRSGWGDSVVSLYSFSKEFGMAGFRVGAAIGRPDVLIEVGKLLDCVAVSAPRIAQEVALAALAVPHAQRRRRAARFVERHRRFVRMMAGRPGGFELDASGAFFGWVRHPFGAEPADSVSGRLIREEGVLALPGTVFGPLEDDHLRFSVAAIEDEQLPEMRQRLERFGRAARRMPAQGVAVAARR